MSKQIATGITFKPAGVVWYGFRPLHWWERIFFVVDENNARRFRWLLPPQGGAK